MTIEELVEKDSSFNSSIFISKANNMIKKLYNAITLEELDTINYFASDEVFNSFKKKVEEAKANHEVLTYEQVSVSTEIKSIDEVNGYYKISCNAYCKYYETYYSENGKYLYGDKDAPREVIHQAIFSKKIGTGLENVVRCVGCGMSLNVNESRKCPNCGRIFEAEDFDYYLELYV